MLRQIILLGGALLVVGCASSSSKGPASLSDALHGMIGQPVRAMESKLGSAPSLHPTKNGNAYTWIVKAASTTPGGKRAGGNNARGAEIAAALRSNPNAVSQPQPCTITVNADKNEIIRTIHLSGDGQCGYFDQAFGVGR